MIITSYMHKIIQIHPCLLKLSRKQESVMDGHSRYYYIPHRYRGGIITSHMQEIIQIYPCLLKLSRKQDTILKIGDFQPKTKIFPKNPVSNISM